MTRKYLQDWYNSSDITYSEKERLNKIGVNDYDYHYLQDLKQIIYCENRANDLSEIKSKLSSKRIKKIIFFTPNFNNDKPNASNYSCAVVVEGNDNVWVIVYRPSYAGGIGSDIVVKKTDVSASEAERKLNGNYPVVAISPKTDISFLPVIMSWPYICEKTLPSDARYNPDKYILPLDIVKRPINNSFDHYAIYLGNKWVVHLLGGGKPTKFDTWSEFYDPSNTKKGGSSGTKTVYHPQIPFKRKEEIIRHIAKAVSYNYAQYSYDPKTNNCEHIVRRCVLGIDISPQTLPYSVVPTTTFELINPFENAVLDSMENKSTLEERINLENNKLNGLTSNYSYEKNRIEQYIQEAKNNHSYNRSKYLIEQEKFQERIEVYPKDWCQIS